MKTILLMLVAAALSLLAIPALAFEVKPDGTFVLHPEEQKMLDACKAAGGGCFIVNRETVERYAKARVAQAADEVRAAVMAAVMAELQDEFDAAVDAKAKTMAKDGAELICRDKI